MSERNRSCIIIGAGLAGLTCAFELADQGLRPTVLESKPFVGGRTASWNDGGMAVESGLHRVLGVYRALPQLLSRAGVAIDSIVVWEDAFEIRVPDGGPRAVFGAAPLHRPFRTAAGLLGNNQLIGPADKVRFGRFVTGGLTDYFRRPLALDEQSVAEYARRHGVPERLLATLITAFTAGLFFLPPDRYSAYAFFGHLGPFLSRLLKFRVGGFAGGMTDVMAQPLADAVAKRGGTVRTQAGVSRLLLEQDRVCGVELVSGECLAAETTVVATSLYAAQCLLKAHFNTHPALTSFFNLKSMPAVTMQCELHHPATPLDRTTFAPGTALATFSEQSRTTFRHTRGRLSGILSDPRDLIRWSDDKLLHLTECEAKRLDLDLAITDYRVIRHPADFYSLEPGMERLRPKQRTPIQGLVLAGDYTKQPCLATMEGAVVSGLRAARVVMAESNR
jgi:15-cis-phytoene desaturase